MIVLKIVRINALWCPACLITNSNLDKLLKKYKNIDIESYDYDFDDVSKYNVGKTLPVLILYKNNKEIDRIIGEKSIKELEEKIGVYYEEV